MHALRAFIDDSGSGGDSPWFVLAGYVGTVEAWEAFDKPWRTVLHGPPKVEYFKHSEVYGADTQWAGMSINERNSRIDSLTSVIGKYALRALYVRLKQKDYDDLIKPYIPPEWRNAYCFLFIGFLSAATSSEKYLGDGRRIEFFFDSSQELEKPSRKLYGQVAGMPQFRDKVEDIHYKDEKIFLPLQAADLLAWQVRRRFSVEEPPRTQFDAALNCPPEKPFTHTITREDLDEMGNVMDQEAMIKWAIAGYPEYLRKWKRPR